MLALAYLAATRAHGHQREQGLGSEKGGTKAGGVWLIPLSANEIRRLLTQLVLAPAVCVEQVLPGHTGADDANAKPAPVTTAAAGTHYRHEPSAVAVPTDDTSTEPLLLIGGRNTGRAQKAAAEIGGAKAVVVDLVVKDLGLGRRTVGAVAQPG